MHGRHLGARRRQGDVDALKIEVARSRTFRVLSSPNETSRPIDRSEASAITSSTGNSRSASVCSISRPTFPVAPITATL
jgi:hypothetical protein